MPQRSMRLAGSVALVAALGVTGTAAHGALIGIDFGATGKTLTDASAVAGAPGLEQANWNSAPSNSTPTPLALVDATGAAGGSLRWFSDGGTDSNSNTNAPADQKSPHRQIFDSAIFSDQATSSNTTEEVRIVVSGLPGSFADSGYGLVVYYDASTAAVNSGPMTARVDYGNTSTTGDIAGTADVTQAYENDGTIFSGTYVEYPGTVAGSNFVRLADTGSLGTTGFVLTLRANSADTAERAVIAGLQIVPVPEPTALGLVGLGGMALLARRRR